MVFMSSYENLCGAEVRFHFLTLDSVRERKTGKVKEEMKRETGRGRKMGGVGD